MEASRSPEKALPSADRLAAIMPKAGHMVHMPSHIDAWVGQWKEAIECNIAAVAADDAYVEQSGNESQFYKFYRMHNHHFVVWCAMFDGQYETALNSWEPLARAGNARAQNNIGACFVDGLASPQAVAALDGAGPRPHGRADRVVDARLPKVRRDPV